MDNKIEMYETCVDDPTTIFKIINKGYFDIVEELIDEKKIDINICDTLHNSLSIRLLKAKQYDLVLKIIKRRNFNVNYQNDDGNTFSHFLSIDNNFRTIKIIEQLLKKSNYNPNIKNKLGETAFDRSINNNCLINSLKFFEDKRFTSITHYSFIKLYYDCLKDSSFGKFSKKDNFNIIFTSLKKKDLNKNLRNFVNKIESNIDIIKEELSNDKNNCLDLIVKNTLQTA